MERLIIGSVNIDRLKLVVDLKECASDNDWLEDIKSQPNPNEIQQQQLRWIEQMLNTSSPHLLNEATLWARCIYPMLALAEQGNVRAYSEVPIAIKYPDFEVNGIIDGALGQEISGRIKAPYFVVVEAKRGVGAEDPVPQLYAQLLATAQLNYFTYHRTEEPEITIEVFGAYIIADSWTFAKAAISGLTQSPTTMTVQQSREFTQRHQAVDILAILTGIINRQLNTSS